MSERERLYQLLDTVPDSKIAYVIGYIQGLTADGHDEPNAETLEAFAEVEEMKRTGAGQHFSGSTKAKKNAEYLAMLDERMERLNNGGGIHKTMEELKAMEDE